ncbi:HTH domain-containing protein [Kribbella sp. VKM Ac-2527]|uniref:HTH domain-containing protein n=1 Tax=Kribbella caucasensis TaxID=2512215 RepID=A0A4V3CAN5_9ACTN|nr:helix-turn-helix domain-containing protein [Kribbella sp. VKM Ac-2527]TDO50618.1 HTH domain-containing protein [Kribbella sp. VKM Ac-2527]
MTELEGHPLVVAITPLVERLNAELVPPDEARADDVPLLWEGSPVAAVRLPRKASAGGEGGVNALLAEVAEEVGGPLHELSRNEKQQAVLLLEAKGAFEYRKSAELVAEALGVTRFTVYNYLNRARD